MIVETEAPGGQAGMSSRIENYLGFPSGLSGGDLARRAVVQAQPFRRGNSGSSDCREYADGRVVPHHQAGGRQRDLLPRFDDRHWRAVASGSRLRASIACRERESITVAVLPKLFPVKERSFTWWAGRIPPAKRR